ncbi:hypothetical protein EYZ11_002185 [Aspergillus tanneri]|uniref:Haloacid dehalogenase, type II n=1 Tax=Aspergillus tanneri TaxID=1220188 RepID=A0A4V3UQC1_9EURO|nr:uncharacterized protein ATNIH1004_008970 [Aspergillus tanneri]KAA8644762.1 hypothetical protein ATNIH1004_008970 [Aspergillus tanneri]THC98324.1 hypothetical protein EYZ11_002185 [Aspergillus tanneri]
MSQQTIVAFELYGTLLSPSSLIEELSKHVPNASKVARAWRVRQLEYTWRLSSKECYVPFNEIIRNALIHTLDEMGYGIRQPDLKKILSAYDHMPTFEDVDQTLDQLAEIENLAPIIFTDETEERVSKSVLQPVLHAPPMSRQTPKLKEVIYVDGLLKYKPAAEVYDHLARRVGKSPLRRKEIWIVSSEPADIVGALHAGMKAIWVDRDKKGWKDRAAPHLHPFYTVASLEGIIVPLQLAASSQGRYD